MILDEKRKTLSNSCFIGNCIRAFFLSPQIQGPCISFFGNNQCMPNFLLFAKVALADVSHEIPAYAGETQVSSTRLRRTQVHPRLRGVNHCPHTLNSHSQGPPPLTRGKQFTNRFCETLLGPSPLTRGKQRQREDLRYAAGSTPRLRGVNFDRYAILIKYRGPPPLSRVDIGMV